MSLDFSESQVNYAYMAKISPNAESLPGLGKIDVPDWKRIFRDETEAQFTNNGDSETNGELWLWSLLEPKVSVMVDVGVCKELTYADNGRTMQHCFEPNPALCNVLKKFASSTVVLNNVGLSSASGKIRYYAHGDTMHFRSMFGCSKDCKCARIVDVTTLDEYCDAKGISRLDFIKIDVEGHELEVLKGAQRILDSTEFVQFEYGGTYFDSSVKLSDVYELLRKHGFTHFYLICPEYLALCSKPIENYAYSNYLATRGEPKLSVPEDETRRYKAPPKPILQQQPRIHPACIPKLVTRPPRNNQPTRAAHKKLIEASIAQATQSSK